MEQSERDVPPRTAMPEPWFPKRRGSEVSHAHEPLSGRRFSDVSTRPQGKQSNGGKWYNFKTFVEDEEDADWWFAGTGIPLIAAAIGPLANVLSIAALVTSWRMCLVDGVDPTTCEWNGDQNALLGDLEGHSFADPRWCYALNVVSLTVGFVGNLFLLFNFTGRVRYIIALPVTIFMWYIATGILIGITISMNVHVPPIRPQQTYTQGFWYGVLAAILYLISSMLLMVNMLGYFLGHYSERFELSDSQRTLILQTMMFFIWLAGGGAVFMRVESLYGDGSFDWSFVNALYFCDVTIITVGFGDLYCTSNVGRGLVFPYSVGGIIMLGLVISSISKFAAELGSDKIIQRHVERSRARTFERSVTDSIELERRQLPDISSGRLQISGPISSEDRSTTLRIVDDKTAEKNEARKRAVTPLSMLRRTATNTLNVISPVTPKSTRSKKSRLLLLREQKDRFDAMRTIQHNTGQWKQWYALSISVTAFGTLWCVGAIVFWQAEQRSQQLTYFEALYFCYVSLLTIGYGDLAPKSNLGRPFFVLWSLVAVPTMTILVSDMGDTLINKFKKGTSTLADFTVLPKSGIWHDYLQRHPWLLLRIENYKEKRDAKKRLARGFETGPDPEDPVQDLRITPTIEQLANDEVAPPSQFQLARKLAQAIRNTANDMKEGKKKYSYEEWVELTQLIRFTKTDKVEEEEEDLIEWDWIGEDSPMMAKKTEPEFVLDRLCESMGRYIRNMNPQTEEEDATERKRSIQKLDTRSSSEDTRRGPTDNGVEASTTGKKAQT